MSRQSLPELRAHMGGHPFFPSFQKELNRLVDQFRSGLALPDTARAGIRKIDITKG